MQSILTITLPFFGLVLCGYLAARRGVLPLEAVPGLNAYVLFFALPCLLFRFGASMPLAQLIDPVLAGVYALCAVLIVAITVALTWQRHAVEGSTDLTAYRVDLKNAAFGALVAAFPNTGFMGVPLLVALFGAAAAGPVIGTIVVDLVLTSTLCIALAQGRSKQGHSKRDDERGDEADSAGGGAWGGTARSVAASLRTALTNPLPWAIALGALAYATRVELPGALVTMIRLLADSASPVALFTIGAVLWRAEAMDARQHTPLREVVPIALIKLLLHPLLVLCVGLGARALGTPVSDFGLTVLVLAAALPSASNVSLLAERYGADTGRVARIILVSTLLAFFSFSLLAWALGAGVN